MAARTQHNARLRGTACTCNLPDICWVYLLCGAALDLRACRLAGFVAA